MLCQALRPKPLTAFVLATSTSKTEVLVRVDRACSLAFEVMHES